MQKMYFKATVKQSDCCWSFAVKCIFGFRWAWLQDMAVARNEVLPRFNNCWSSRTGDAFMHPPTCKSERNNPLNAYYWQPAIWRRGTFLPSIGSRLERSGPPGDSHMPAWKSCLGGIGKPSGRQKASTFGKPLGLVVGMADPAHRFKGPALRRPDLHGPCHPPYESAKGGECGAYCALGRLL